MWQNRDILQKIGTRRTSILKIRKRMFKIVGHILWKEENIESFGKFNMDLTFWSRRKKQRRNCPNEIAWMDFREGTSRKDKVPNDVETSATCGEPWWPSTWLILWFIVSLYFYKENFLDFLKLWFNVHRFHLRFSIAFYMAFLALG